MGLFQAEKDWVDQPSLGRPGHKLYTMAVIELRALMRDHGLQG